MRPGRHAMPLPSNNLQFRIFGLSLALTLLTGCVSSQPAPRSSAVVHVHVSARGTISYPGGHCSAEQLPDQLARADVKPTQDIRVHMEDIHDTRLMSRIYSALHNKGYLHVLFRDEPRASSAVVGEPDSFTEAPLPHDAPQQPKAP